jgi:hypothetical protein
MQRTASPSSDYLAAQSLTPKLLSTPASATTDPSLARRRSLKGSRSAENLRSLATTKPKPASRALEALCKPIKESSLSLAIASQSSVPATHHHIHQPRTASDTLVDKRPADRRQLTNVPGLREVNPPVRHNSLEVGSPMSPVRALATSPPPSPLIPASVRNSNTRVPPIPAGSAASGTKKVQRRSPPPPPKRRKPPAVPMRVVGTSNSGAQISAIASSTSAPALGKT